MAAKPTSSKKELIPTFAENVDVLLISLRYTSLWLSQGLNDLIS